MRRQVEQRQECRPCPPVAPKPEAERCGRESRQQVEPLSCPFAQADDERPFAAAGILLAVTVVVDHQQCVDHQAAGCRDDRHLPCPAAAEDVVRAADGDESEEKQYEHVAPAVVGQRVRPGRVEECEEDAGGADGDEPPAPVGDEPAARGAGGECGCGDAQPHGLRGDPPLGAGAFRPEAVFSVGAFQVIPQVVYQVGVDLHQQGECEAEYRGQKDEPAVRRRKAAAQHHRDGGSGQCLGTCRKQPCPQGIGAYLFCSHRFGLWARGYPGFTTRWVPAPR